LNEDDQHAFVLQYLEKSNQQLHAFLKSLGLKHPKEKIFSLQKSFKRNLSTSLSNFLPQMFGVQKDVYVTINVVILEKIIFLFKN